MSYGNWSNYATWRVASYILNDPGLYDEFESRREVCIEIGNTRDKAVHHISSWIHRILDSAYDDALYVLHQGSIGFLLLSRPDDLNIDCNEIADRLLGDYDNIMKGSVSQNRRPISVGKQVGSNACKPKKKSVASNGCKSKGKPAPKKRTPAKKPAKKAPAGRSSR